VPFAITADSTLDCDVVVIGSGAGGGVVAGELARAGKSVVLLEKGAYLNEADFTHREDDGLSRLYDARGLTATSDLGLLLLQGSCLGGGTVVNYTTSFRTPRAVRVQWAKEHGLPHFTSPEFTRNLDAVAQRIHVNADHAEPSGRDRVMIRGLERCGWHHGLLPRNVDGCPQDDGCGYCIYGCRHGAKRSTLVTYLQDAYDHSARIVVSADVRHGPDPRCSATAFAGGARQSGGRGLRFHPHPGSPAPLRPHPSGHRQAPRAASRHGGARADGRAGATVERHHAGALLRSIRRSR
jgi:choline dehydrogenase-like flavoprotein